MTRPACETASLKIRGGAVDKVLGTLKTKGLIAHHGMPRDDNPPPLRITRAGLEAVGVEPEDESDVDTGAAETEAAPAATEVDTGSTTAKSKAKAAERGEATPGEKPALMIEMLKRPEGATVEQIAEATGWQHHTIRGAISGALKNKLGLTVEARRSAPTTEVGAGSQARRTREIGPNKTGARAALRSTASSRPGDGPQAQAARLSSPRAR
jgi:Protein of unknown function (DUF3489)